MSKTITISRSWLVMLSFAGASTLQGQDECSFTARPQISSVQNSASSGSEVSFNSLVTIFGSGFVPPGSERAVGRRDFVNGNYPTELGCVAVEIGGRRVPVLYVGVNQINTQVPTIASAAPIEVRVILNPGRPQEVRSAPASIQLRSASPALFTLAGQTVSARHTNDDRVADVGAASNARPARQGDIVTLYGTGFGPTEPVFQAGEIPKLPAPLRSAFSITLGGSALAPEDILFAGVAPGQISGVYRFDIRVPLSSTIGELPVVVETQGASTQGNVTLPVRQPRTLRVPGDFATIQAALNSAAPGDTIRVGAGRYNEKVKIEKSGLRLVAPTGADRAIIDGTGLFGHGIHVLGTPARPVSGVEINGFVVENFENGITLENTILSQVRLNISQNHFDKVAPWAGVIEADAFLLINAHFNTLSGNLAQRAGHDAIMVTGGSKGNLFQGNRLQLTGFDHGVTWTGPWITRGGCCVLLAGVGNDNNTIRENECAANDWGIQIAASSGNVIAQNYSSGNTRAGILLGAAASGNLIVDNHSVGNGLLNLAPSMTFDIFSSAPPNANTWLRNKGTANVP